MLLVMPQCPKRFVVEHGVFTVHAARGATVTRCWSQRLTVFDMNDAYWYPVIVFVYSRIVWRILNSKPALRLWIRVVNRAVPKS